MCLKTAGTVQMPSRLGGKSAHLASPGSVFAASNETPAGGYPLFYSVLTYDATQTKWRKSGQTQYEYAALLLFDGSPLLLTLRKLLELFGFAERSHQLLPIYGCPPLDTPQGEHREVNSHRELGFGFK